MTLWSWFFPSPQDRVAAARKDLEAGRAASARDRILDLDLPEATEVLHAAENQLAMDNLSAALQYCRVGDDQRVHQHLELAEQFHHGGLDDRFREVRRELRGIRADRDLELERAREEKRIKQMQVDPLGLTGGASLLDPEVPTDLYDADRMELEARVGLLIENYPEPLRETLPTLGAGFTRAVLDLDEGRADKALQALLTLDDEAALVNWERARAAHALGDPAAAARAVRRFAERAGGHFPMGRLHSGVFLAQLTTEAGDLPGALRTLRSVRQDDPDVGGFLYAQLLQANGKLPEAETVLAKMIKAHPRTMALYKLMAQVRLQGGHRVAAMQVLEAGLGAQCCTPGKCGYQPPDREMMRTLATLYFEDGIQTPRALELAEQVAALTENVGWEEAYLHALALRAEGDPQGNAIALRLHERTGESDPRRARLVQHLPLHP